MKRLLYFALLAMACIITGCSDDEPAPVTPDVPVLPEDTEKPAIVIFNGKAQGDAVYKKVTDTSFSIDGVIYKLISDNTLSITGLEPDASPASLTPYVTILLEDKILTTTSVAPYAFKNNQSITAVKIPETITTIGEGAFDGAYLLNKVEVEGRTAIEKIAFRNCVSLPSFYGPNVPSIGPYAFAGCSSLKEVSASSSQSVGMYAFKDCTSLNHINFKGATEIGRGCFAQSHLSEGQLILTVKELPDSVFTSIHAVQLILNECTKIGKYNFPDSYITYVSMERVREIDDYSFYNCDFMYINSFDTWNALTFEHLEKVGDYCLSDITTKGSRPVIMPEIKEIGNHSMVATRARIIEFGPNIKSIGEGSVQDIENVAINAIVPPVVGKNALRPSSTCTNPTLYVPSSAMDTYKNSAPWNENFKSFKEIPDVKKWPWR